MTATAKRPNRMPGSAAAQSSGALPHEVLDTRVGDTRDSFSRLGTHVEPWTPGAEHPGRPRRTRFFVSKPDNAAISTELKRSRAATVAIMTQSFTAN
jgi:hypothetical protein